MKNLKTFLFILSIAVIASCSPKEESPELAKDPTNTGGTGGGGTGGGGTGGGGGGTGGGGGGTGGGPVANPFYTANYFDPSGVATGGTHTSASFDAYDSLGEFTLIGYASKTILSMSFASIKTTGQYPLTSTNTVFISNTDSAFATPPYDPRFFYDLMPMEQNSVNISKIDTIDHTIKGTFSFRGLNSDNDTFSIATGSFELNYRKN